MAKNEGFSQISAICESQISLKTHILGTIYGLKQRAQLESPGRERNRCMWCVMHVKPGSEKRMEEFLDGLIGDEFDSRCFHLTRLRRKKYGGRWQTIEEQLLPGYVFIVTEKPEQLYREFEKVPGCGLLGDSKEYVSRLDGEEAEFLEKIAGSADGEGAASRIGEIGLSYIKVEKDNRVRVLSGPLLFVEKQVRKIDFHRRVAEVETNLCGEKKVMYLGVEFENVS